MVGSNENHPAVIRPANIQEGLLPRVGKLAAGMGHYQEDVDDYKVAGDSPIPMFVQHTEAMLEKIDRMVEMEDTTDEPVDDIKSSDKRNPLAVVEYIDDIYAYYKKVEVVCSFRYTC
ncbi:hypothetical protein TEA_022853 [Camellia sinensis var. sinensis]|uniref:Uncharacterized protein n=1 Tax=Camellia sinensis var. sinensis TaxID=542762 RepID=A0A4S4D9L3_CAMSN|nr:hypothetical protein TEA_022853 [Camellia sinensis var. sinensis]